MGPPDARDQHRCEISTIAVDEEDVEEAKAGDNVRLKLKNCEEEVRAAGPPGAADVAAPVPH